MKFLFMSEHEKTFSGFLAALFPFLSYTLMLDDADDDDDDGIWQKVEKFSLIWSEMDTALCWLCWLLMYFDSNVITFELNLKDKLLYNLHCSQKKHKLILLKPETWNDGFNKHLENSFFLAV